MYVVEKKAQKVIQDIWDHQGQDIASDFNGINEANQVYKQIMDEGNSGRPGHYWGRDCVIEGSIPAAHFFMAEGEYEGDKDWYKDDRKFQDFMKRYPRYNWLKR